MFFHSKLSMVYQCNGCGNVSFQKLGVVNIKGDKGKKCKSYSLATGPPVDRECSHCGGKHQVTINLLQNYCEVLPVLFSIIFAFLFQIGGPIWTDPIHDVQYVAELLQVVDKLDLGTKKRILGTLSVIREELPDVPLYYKTDKLCSTVHSSTVPMMAFR